MGKVVVVASIERTAYEIFALARDSTSCPAEGISEEDRAAVRTDRMQ